MAKAVQKSSNAVLSHCKCEENHLATISQTDCPWCGCGWLFTCAECRKAFTLGRVVETELSGRELGAKLLKLPGLSFDEDAEADAMAGWLEQALAEIPVGTEVAYLDSRIIPLAAQDVAFSGWFARHELPQLPQATEITADALAEKLGLSYWMDHALPPDERL